MKKVFIHIGFAKTGSSALQYWFFKNKNKLKFFNVYYKTKGDYNKKVSSGNGNVLINFLNGELSASKVAKFYGFEDHNTCSLISSERIRITEDKLVLLKELSRSYSLDLTFVAFVREPLYWLHSRYLQSVKRHGFTGEFTDFINENKRLSFIVESERLYRSGFSFKLFKFEDHSSDLRQPFCSLLGINKEKLYKIENVNRSLSNAEAEFVKSFEAYMKEHSLEGSGRMLADELINSYEFSGDKPKISLSEAQTAFLKYGDNVSDFNKKIASNYGFSLDKEFKTENAMGNQDSLNSLVEDLAFQRLFMKLFKDNDIATRFFSEMQSQIKNEITR